MSQKQEEDLWQEDHTINISGKNDEISCCDQEKLYIYYIYTLYIYILYIYYIYTIYIYTIYIYILYIYILYIYTLMKMDRKSWTCGTDEVKHGRTSLTRCWKKLICFPGTLAVVIAEEPSTHRPLPSAFQVAAHK